MTVGVLLVTHVGIGDALLDVAASIYGDAPLASATLGVPRDADTQSCFERGMALARELDGGDGVLVMSDLFGSTPSNVAVRIGQTLDFPVIAGVNLPMLVRVFNYPDLALPELARRAVEGGRAGVII